MVTLPTPAFKPDELATETGRLFRALLHVD